MARKPTKDPFEDEMTNPYGEEEGEDPFIAALNNPERVDLTQYDPGDISSDEGPSTPYNGEMPRSFVGRPTSPKIWANAHLHPNVETLRVWKVINGAPVFCGSVGVDVTEEEFIHEMYDFMPKIGEGQGKFRVRPVSREGHEVREEVTLPPIHEMHLTLKAIRAARAAAEEEHSARHPQENTVMQDLLVDRLRNFELKEEMAQDQIRRNQDHLAEERVALIRETLRTQEAMAEKALKNESERSQNTLQFITAYNEKSSGLSEAFYAREREAAERRAREDQMRWERDREEARAKYERDREEERRRREDEREEYKRKLEEERHENQRKWEREKAEREMEMKEKEAQRQREHEFKLKAIDVDAQRDREHRERMMQLSTVAKGESIEGLFERGTKLLGMVGLTPNELIEKFTGGGGTAEEPTNKTSAADVLVAILPEVIKVLPKVLNRPPAQGAGTGSNGAPLLAQNLPQQFSGINPQNAASPIGVPVEQAPQPVQAPAPPPGPETRLHVSIAKRVRVAVRELVKTLKTEPQEAWAIRVMSAIANEPDIATYCEDVSLPYALEEAGASPELMEKIYNHPELRAMVGFSKD